MEIELKNFSPKFGYVGKLIVNVLTYAFRISNDQL